MTRTRLIEEIIAAVWAWLEPRHAADDVTRLYVREKFLPLIDRYVAERDAAIRPLVKAVVGQHRDFPPEGRSVHFDGPYGYSVRVRLSSETLEAAEQWLAAQVKVEEPKR